MKCVEITSTGKQCVRNGGEDVHGKPYCQMHAGIIRRVEAAIEPCGVNCPHPGNLRRLVKCTLRHRVAAAPEHQIHAVVNEGHVFIWKGKEPNRNWEATVSAT